MCGIFGYINKKELNDREVFDPLSKRGPDNSSIVELKNFEDGGNICKVFHTRLSIIDVDSRSDQPLFDDNERFVITYNGELYNFKELKNVLSSKGYTFKTESDTEVVLKAYIEWGENMLGKLRGMFAFAIFDKLLSKIFLARDIFGIKPLYYLFNEDSFVFSSLLTAILKSGVKNKFHLNKSAIQTFLYTGSFIAPETISKEIKLLPPGHSLLYSQGEMSINKYSDLSSFIEQDKFGSYEKVKKDVRDTLIDSVEKHFIADVPVGVLLSGGIDSSLIAGISSRILNKRINTYSIGYKDNKFKKIDETGVAQKTAHFINSAHENILIDFVDFNDLFTEFIDAIDVPSIDGFNTFIISKKIAQRVKVVLSGLGGDEMFAGYPIYKNVFYSRNLSLLDKTISSRVPSKVLFLLKKNHIEYRNKSVNDILIRYRNFNESSTDEVLSILENLMTNRGSDIERVSIYEIQRYMINTLLRDSDAVSMFSGLEMRVPFVDKEVMKVAFKILDKMKFNKSYNKPVLVDSFKDVLLPEVYLSKKRGFSLPVPTWAKTYFNDLPIEDVYQTFFVNNSDFDPSFDTNFLTANKPDYNYYKWGILLSWLNNNHSYFEE